MYQRIDLSGPTAVGVPGGLPVELRGLALSTLEDLSPLAESVLQHVGFGYWPVMDAPRPTPTERLEIAVTPSLEIDAVDKRVLRQFDLVDRSLPERQLDMVRALRARLDEVIAVGFDYEVAGSGITHTYQIDATAQSNMLAIEAEFLGGEVNAHGGYWRSADNLNVVMTDADVRAFFRAAKLFKMTAIRNAQALTDAVRACGDHAALDALNLDAGWP